MGDSAPALGDRWLWGFGLLRLGPVDLHRSMLAAVAPGLVVGCVGVSGCPPFDSDECPNRKIGCASNTEYRWCHPAGPCVSHWVVGHCPQDRPLCDASKAPDGYSNSAMKVCVESDVSAGGSTSAQ